MKQPIWNINDDFEPQEDQPNNSDFLDEDYFEYDDDDEPTCETCRGCGEGVAAGTTCSSCHGRGTIKKHKY